MTPLYRLLYIIDIIGRKKRAKKRGYLKPLFLFCFPISFCSNTDNPINRIIEIIRKMFDLFCAVDSPNACGTDVKSFLTCLNHKLFPGVYARILYNYCFLVLSWLNWLLQAQLMVWGFQLFHICELQFHYL